MERGHHDIERRQHFVRKVELPVGPDLELAAVQQPEPSGRAAGAGRNGSLLAREARVQLVHDRGAAGRSGRGRGRCAIAKLTVWSVRTW